MDIILVLSIKSEKPNCKSAPPISAFAKSNISRFASGVLIPMESNSVNCLLVRLLGKLKLIHAVGAFTNILSSYTTSKSRTSKAPLALILCKSIAIKSSNLKLVFTSPLARPFMSTFIPSGKNHAISGKFKSPLIWKSHLKSPIKSVISPLALNNDVPVFADKSVILTDDFACGFISINTTAVPFTDFKTYGKPL